MLRIPERPLWPRLVFAFAFRYACFATMIWLSLYAETRAAPTLPDAVLERVPYVPWVDRYNYVLWLFAYAPAALMLMLVNARRFVRYMVTSGAMSVFRALCILATGLGPVRGGDVNAGMDAQTRWKAFAGIVNPFSALMGDAPHAYLTKDLFFSGHTSTTFLLLLYVWPYPRLRALMLVGHVLVVASLFLSHLHYTIDVIGGYAIAFCFFAISQRKVGAVVQAER